MTALEGFTQWALAPAGIAYAVAPESENAEYSAAVLTVGDVRIRARQARVTPSKPGAFVSVWRRSPGGDTEPFPAADAGDGLLVFVADGVDQGLFFFTPEHLERLGVTRSATSPGKRGFRVYPAWCAGLNAQATRAQRAQSQAFIDTSDGRPMPPRDEILTRLGIG